MAIPFKFQPHKNLKEKMILAVSLLTLPGHNFTQRVIIKHCLHSDIFVTGIEKPDKIYWGITANFSYWLKEKDCPLSHGITKVFRHEYNRTVYKLQLQLHIYNVSDSSLIVHNICQSVICFWLIRFSKLKASCNRCYSDIVTPCYVCSCTDITRDISTPGGKPNTLEFQI